MTATAFEDNSDFEDVCMVETLNTYGTTVSTQTHTIFPGVYPYSSNKYRSPVVKRSPLA